MATYYNEEHEAIISTEVEAIGTAKEGEIVPHKQKVNSIEVLIATGHNEYRKHHFSRRAIIDLYKQIQKIERKKFMLPFVDDRPF